MQNYINFYRAYEELKTRFEREPEYLQIIDQLNRSDSGKDLFSGHYSRREVDLDWVEFIEGKLLYIDMAIRENRRFIEIIEDIVPIEKAKRITNESIRHLAQHTSMISKVEDDGTVTPERILNIEREESFAIYENRFLRTLLQNLCIFVDKRIDAVAKMADDCSYTIQMDRKFTYGGEAVKFELNYVYDKIEASTDTSMKADVSQMTGVQRVMRIRKILTDFLSTPLMRALQGCEPVRPPIIRTNLIRKNTNYKNALELYLYVESYHKPGFTLISGEAQDIIKPTIKSEMNDALLFAHFIIKLNADKTLREALAREYAAEFGARATELAQTAKQTANRWKSMVDEIKSVELAKMYAEMKTLQDKVDALQELLDSYTRELEELQNKNADLEAQLAQISDELEMERRRYSEDLRREVQEKESLLSQLSNTYESLLNDLTEDYERELAVEKAAHSAEVEQERSMRENMVTTLTQKYEAQLADERENREKKIADYKAEITKVLENEKTMHSAEISQIKADWQADLERERARCRQEVQKIQELRSKELAEEKKYWENKMMTDKANELRQHSIEMDQLREEMEEKFTKATEQYKANIDAERNYLNNYWKSVVDRNMQEFEKELTETRRNAEQQVAIERRKASLKAAKATKEAKESVSKARESAKKEIASAQRMSDANQWMGVYQYREMLKISQKVILPAFAGIGGERIKIITDALCGRSIERLKSYNVSVLPIGIGEDDPCKAVRIMKPYIESGAKILFIGADARFSHSCDIVKLIQADTGYKDIYIFESNTLLGGLAIQIMRAAKMIKEGHNFDSIRRALELMRPNANADFIFGKESESYLKQFVPELYEDGKESLMGTVVSYKQGKMSVGKRYNMDADFAVFNYLEEMRDTFLLSNDGYFHIWHTGCSEETLNEIKSYVEELGYFKKVYTNQAPACFTDKYGPDAFGFVYYDATLNLDDYYRLSKRVAQYVETNRIPRKDIRIITDSLCSFTETDAKRFSVTVLDNEFEVNPFESEVNTLATPILRWEEQPLQYKLLYMLESYVLTGCEVIYFGANTTFSKYSKVMQEVINDLNCPRVRMFEPSDVVGSVELLALKALSLKQHSAKISIALSELDYFNTLTNSIVMAESFLELADSGLYKLNDKYLEKEMKGKAIAQIRNGEAFSLRRFRFGRIGALLDYLDSCAEKIEATRFGTVVVIFNDCDDKILDAVRESIESMNNITSIAMFESQTPLLGMCGRSVSVCYYDGDDFNEGEIIG